MEPFEKAEMEIIEFSVPDVITSSCETLEGGRYCGLVVPD